MEINKKSNLLNRTILAYKKRSLNHGLSPKGVFWQNSGTQNSRFETLIKAIIKSDIGGKISLTDYGCGYGEFYNFIKNKSFMEKSKFIGYDIVDTFIDAAKLKFPQAEWVCSDQISLKTDYVFISGTFNMAFDNSIHEWETLLENQLEKCFSYTEKVLAFNLLYSEKSKIEEGLYYTEINKIFDFCSQKLGETIISKTKGANKDITIFVSK